MYSRLENGNVFYHYFSSLFSIISIWLRALPGFLRFRKNFKKNKTKNKNELQLEFLKLKGSAGDQHTFTKRKEKLIFDISKINETITWLNWRVLKRRYYKQSIEDSRQLFIVIIFFLFVFKYLYDKGIKCFKNPIRLSMFG